VQKALPLFNDGGSIILNAALVTSKGLPAFSVCSAAKAAIRSFARCWTADLQARKIRVNAVSPGLIDTPLWNNFAATEKEVAELKERFTSSVPMGRYGTADEIAKAVSFLASGESSYVTGTELFVDGGMAQL
jgi:NAD(P)-dependent dehydrogenase (short-subunit alcohol dehydrogenase family)